MQVVTLSQVRALREAYKMGTFPALSAGVTPRYPARADLLDRVSLWSVPKDSGAWPCLRDLCGRQGDITKLEVDAIVNAANQSLLGACFAVYYEKDSQSLPITGGGGGTVPGFPGHVCAQASSTQWMAPFITLQGGIYSKNARSGDT
jgi:hypothetical protein